MQSSAVVKLRKLFNIAHTIIWSPKTTDISPIKAKTSMDNL